MFLSALSTTSHIEFFESLIQCFIIRVGRYTGWHWCHVSFQSVLICRPNRYQFSKSLTSADSWLRVWVGWPVLSHFGNKLIACPVILSSNCHIFKLHTILVSLHLCSYISYKNTIVLQLHLSVIIRHSIKLAQYLVFHITEAIWYHSNTDSYTTYTPDYKCTLTLRISIGYVHQRWLPQSQHRRFYCYLVLHSSYTIWFWCSTVCGRYCVLQHYLACIAMELITMDCGMTTAIY